MFFEAIILRYTQQTVVLCWIAKERSVDGLWWSPIRKAYEKSHVLLLQRAQETPPDLVNIEPLLCEYIHTCMYNNNSSIGKEVGRDACSLGGFSDRLAKGPKSRRANYCKRRYLSSDMFVLVLLASAVARAFAVRTVAGLLPRCLYNPFQMSGRLLSRVRLRVCCI